MGFRLGDITEKTEAGALRGTRLQVACDCWFTSGGRTIPRLIKLMDEEGVLHMIPVVQLLSSEQKNYSGIHTVEHICRIPVGDREETVRLIFTNENCQWALVFLPDRAAES